MRPLDILANDTPKDYLSYIPKDPTQLGLQMITKAERLYPLHVPESQGENVIAFPTTYDLLYVGPGSGLVIQTIISQGHIGNGIETSRRGIATAPDLVRNHINWQLPWETPFRNKHFHVTLISKYLKTLLQPDEWAATVTEMKRISKYLAYA